MVGMNSVSTSARGGQINEEAACVVRLPYLRQRMLEELIIEPPDGAHALHPLDEFRRADHAVDLGDELLEAVAHAQLVDLRRAGFREAGAGVAVEARAESLAQGSAGIQGLYCPISSPEEIGVVSAQLAYANIKTRLLGSGEWNSLSISAFPPLGDGFFAGVACCP